MSLKPQSPTLDLHFTQHLFISTKSNKLSTRSIATFMPPQGLPRSHYRCLASIKSHSLHRSKSSHKPCLFFHFFFPPKFVQIEPSFEETNHTISPLVSNLQKPRIQPTTIAAHANMHGQQLWWSFQAPFLSFHSLHWWHNLPSMTKTQKIDSQPLSICTVNSHTTNRSICIVACFVYQPSPRSRLPMCRLIHLMLSMMSSCPISLAMSAPHQH